MEAQQFRKYSLFVLFLAMICFPLVNGFTHLVDDIPAFENRRLSQKPDFNINLLDPFPEKFNAYYNDTFNLRNRLIRYFNEYNIRVFRQSPVKTVVIGKNKWLFLANEELDSYIGKNRFTLTELKQIRDELVYRRDYLYQKGIKFYFMVVPGKASIYSDKLGYQYYRKTPDTWGEQLNTYLTGNSDLHVIDLYNLLRKNREPLNVFFKLDNHWNDVGGFYAAQEVIRSMKKDFAELQELSLIDFNISTETGANGNINKMFGNLNIFKEEVITLRPKQGYKAKDAERTYYQSPEGFLYPWEFERIKLIHDSKQPRILIISDSFGGAIFPFLSERFSRTTKIFDSWHYKLNEDIVSSEKPDVMLLMISEHLLHNLLKFNMASKPKNSDR